MSDISSLSGRKRGSSEIRKDDGSLAQSKGINGCTSHQEEDDLTLPTT